MYCVKTFKESEKTDFKKFISKLSQREIKYEIWKPPLSYKMGMIPDHKKIFVTLSWNE